MTIKAAYFAANYPWQTVDTAPKETLVLVWGGGPVRFGYIDPLGNWRAAFHGPIRTTPKFWMPIPRPPKPKGVPHD